MRALVVDDERPALDELRFLLGQDARIREVLASDSATESLRILQETDVDVVFLDVQMPGLTGLELAAVLGRFRTPPAIVFVTAHEEHAVEAFDVRAVDYVLKPVRADRLAEAVRRVVEATRGQQGAGGDPAPARDDVSVAVERGGVTRFVDRSAISHVEAQGDYARLHVREGATGGSYLVRTPLSQLEEEWGPAGFVRIHRSLLVSLAHVAELRMDAGRCSVVVSGGTELGVSRRHTRELRDLLLRRSGA
ncbi:LytR/AlgR family response regulator transcription factor [Nocardioides marmotae]|uniref:LytR/AlgR family response regulator transcription factor n=1 Tax=Nocardioides marmotae TaxID=2663857 RepID=UPI0012B55230|nr:LytTR family DNA-binding domain-containing protein [Nocardioides marmotae]MBC9734204.1 response regulator transcription factor [Nocardioides marmotae]MTB85307.1 response regulator [Nocardioides marmotae]